MRVVILTLLATFAIQLGYFLWKIAADTLPQIGKVKPAVAIIGFLTNVKWLSGFVLTVLGWILFIKAANIGDISLVQPLMSIGDLFLVLLALVFLKERLSKKEWLGLGITVVGAILLSLEAKVVLPVGIDWFKFMFFIMVAVVAYAAFMVIAKRSQHQEVPLAIVVGICFGCGAVLTKLMTSYINMQGHHLETMEGIINPIFPFMMAANAAGIVMLQVAFQRGRAAVIVPVELAVVNGMAVLAGAFIFSEHISIFRICSIGLIIGGAAFLHSAKETS